MRSPMKDRMIASVAASYDLVAQTVGNWVARHGKEHLIPDALAPWNIAARTRLSKSFLA